MTLADFNLIAEYWADHPPTHMMVAAYLGIKPAKHAPTASAKDTIAEARTMASQLMTLPGMAQGDVHKGLGAPIFDFEKIRAMRPEPRKATG